jgi:hypothetical protein
MRFPPVDGFGSGGKGALYFGGKQSSSGSLWHGNCAVLDAAEMAPQAALDWIIRSLLAIDEDGFCLGTVAQDE